MNPESMIRCANPRCDHEQGDHYPDDPEELGSLSGNCVYQDAMGGQGCHCRQFVYPDEVTKP